MVTSNMAEICIINCLHVMHLACMPLARDETALLFVQHLVRDQSPYWRLVKCLDHLHRPEFDVFHYISFLPVFLLPKQQFPMRR